MIEIIAYSAGSLVVGAVIALLVVMRDPDLVRLKDDEMIVKRPQDGLVLVALSQEMARRVVLQASTPPKEGNDGEARSLYGKNNP